MSMPYPEILYSQYFMARCAVGAGHEVFASGQCLVDIATQWRTAQIGSCNRTASVRSRYRDTRCGIETRCTRKLAAQAASKAGVMLASRSVLYRDPTALL